MTTDQTMRTLADAATQGPWEVTADTVSSEYGDWVAHGIKDVAATRAYFDSDPYHVALDPIERPDADFIAACREWVPDAIRRIEAVRELHWGDVSVGIHTHICAECRQEYPCPTIRALDGDTS